MAIIPKPVGTVGTPTAKTSQTAAKPANPTAKTSQTAAKPGTPTAKTSQTAAKPGVPTAKTAVAAAKPAVPVNKTAVAAAKPAVPTAKTSLTPGVVPRVFTPRIKLDFEDDSYEGLGSQKVLSDFLTYSRASNAAYMTRKQKGAAGDSWLSYDFNGTVQNLFLYSNDFDNAAWIKTTAGSATAPVITQNYGYAPDGTKTASRAQFVIAADSNANWSMLRQTITNSGDLNTSVWVKSANNQPQYLSILSGGTNYALPFVVDSEWRRIDGYANSGASSTHGLVLRGGQGPGYLTADVLIWRAQCSPSIKVQPYVATTTVSASISVSGQPRREYNPANGESLGLLIEPSSTNLFLRSEEFSNAAWTKTRATIASAAPAPDGSYNASRLQEDSTASNTHSMTQTVTTNASNIYTLSFYLKAYGRRFARIANATLANAHADFDLLTGSASVGAGAINAQIANAGDDWWRCSVTFNSGAGGAQLFALYLASTLGGITYSGDGASSILVWGAQLENHAIWTSYIPTSSATASRGVENAQIQPPYAVAANFERDKTIFSKFRVNGINDISAGLFQNLIRTNETNHLMRVANSSGAYRASVLYGANTISGTDFIVGQKNKVAYSFNSSDGALVLYQNGVQTASGTGTNATGPVTVMQLGAAVPGTAQALFGHICELSIYDLTLTAQEIAQL